MKWILKRHCKIIKASQRGRYGFCFLARQKKGNERKGKETKGNETKRKETKRNETKRMHI
eukprot:SAG11_NODE_492_length_8971_cov_3.819206_2_plen_60_part_00